MTRFKLGGRTAYNLARRRTDGTIRYSQMTVIGPANPDLAIERVLANSTLADWVSMPGCLDIGDPVLVALGPKVYPIPIPAFAADEG